MKNVFPRNNGHFDSELSVDFFRALLKQIKMTALGIDEVDQDIRMSHRQNYRRLSLKYPNITIRYIFAVKEDREGNTNIGFETQECCHPI